MEVLNLQVFVSLLLGAGSIALFIHACRMKDFDHSDRLALLPIENEKKEDQP